MGHGRKEEEGETRRQKRRGRKGAPCLTPSSLFSAARAENATLKRQRNNRDGQIV